MAGAFFLFLYDNRLDVWDFFATFAIAKVVRVTLLRPRTRENTMNESLKIVRVVAAVIRKGDSIFATQRGYGPQRGQWEFPGGKIEPGETPQEALVREIREELDAEIRVGEKITTVEYSYPSFHLSMDVFFCELESDHLILKEHEAAKWLTKETLRSVEWLPADITLIDEIEKQL